MGMNKAHYVVYTPLLVINCTLPEDEYSSIKDDNGTIKARIKSRTNETFMSRAEYSCDDDKTSLRGNPIRYCKNDKTWSKNRLYCKSNLTFNKLTMKRGILREIMLNSMNYP